MGASRRRRLCHSTRINTGACQFMWRGGGGFHLPRGIQTYLCQRNALPAQPDAGSATDESSKQNGSSGDNDTPLSHTSSVRFAQRSSTHASPVAPSATASSSGPITPSADMPPSPPVAGAPPLTPTGAGPAYSSDYDASPSNDQFSGSDSGPPTSWWERRRRTKKVSGVGSTVRGRNVEISPALSQGESMFTTPPSPIHVDEMLQPIDASAVNLVLQPSSPNSASYELHNFSTEDFADRYFATKRSGVLRQRLSLERIMEWQRNPITAPLLVLSKGSVHDAMTTFKIIQHVMGERDRAVESARPPHQPAGPSVLALRGGRDDNKDEKTVILEEIRWMIQLGVGRIEMRDELYCQLIKQLTRNPDKDAAVLGFQLFCVFVAAFGPSKSFEPFVRSFLVGHLERPDYGIGVMSKCMFSSSFPERSASAHL